MGSQSFRRRSRRILRFAGHKKRITIARFWGYHQNYYHRKLATTTAEITATARFCGRQRPQHTTNQNQKEDLEQNSKHSSGLKLSSPLSVTTPGGLDSTSKKGTPQERLTSLPGHPAPTSSVSLIHFEEGCRKRSRF